MGTRHMVGAVIDGEMKLAQYGQWDGYPGGQGVDILAFLRGGDIEKLKDELKKLRFLVEEDQEACKKRWNECGAEEGSTWVTMDQADKFYSEWPFKALSRDLSAGILSEIVAGNVEFVRDDSDFAEDSLFCEWAYVLDLDREVLEVYQGFQKDTPTRGRWAGVRQPGKEYAACSLVGEFPFADLPEDDAFVQTLNEELED